MSSATGRKPTDAGSLLTGRRRIPPGDAANVANPVNAQHLPDCSTADSPLPKPSQHPSCLHCPVRQRLTYFPPTFHRLSLPSDSLSDNASFPPIGQNTYLPHPYNQNRASACPNPNRRGIRHLHIKYVFHTTTEPLLYQSLLLPYNTLSLLIIIKAHHLSFSQDQAEPTLPILFRPIQIPVSSCLLLSFLQSDAIFLFH